MADDKTDERDSAGRVILDVTNEELRSAFSGPAVFSNKFYATTGPSGVRLTFMEALGELVPPVFRTAVLLPFQDALALRDLLTAQLSDIEAMISRAEAQHRAATAKRDADAG